MAAILVAPAARYKDSYLAALREGFRRGDQPAATVRQIRAIEANFAAYIAERTDQSGTLTLPTGEIVPKVPFDVFWLVDGDMFIGEVSVRYELNAFLTKIGGHAGYGIRPSRQRQGYGKLILKLALEQCRCRGIERALVTCLDRNTASARVIEANGGQLENVIDDPRGIGLSRRYWIDLTTVG